VIRWVRTAEANFILLNMHSFSIICPEDLFLGADEMKKIEPRVAFSALEHSQPIPLRVGYEGAPTTRTASGGS
jgi:hypothetical protein